MRQTFIRRRHKLALAQPVMHRDDDRHLRQEAHRLAAYGLDAVVLPVRIESRKRGNHRAQRIHRVSMGHRRDHLRDRRGKRTRLP